MIGEGAARRAYEAAYGHPPDAVAAAPGRVNLIGEHTDYNGGYVCPMALPLGVAAAVGRGEGARVRVASDAFEGVAERGAGEAARGHWSDLVIGALASDSSDGAWDVALASDLPSGAGLSSSAATSVAILRALAAARGERADPVALALAAQRVENDHLGVPCGVMDQMAASVLAPGEAMVLDTAALTHDRLVLPKGWRFTVHHSGVRRELTEGRYAERRADCEAAAQALGVNALCELSALPTDPGARLTERQLRRARHVIADSRRVLAFRDAAADGDLAAAGRTLDESHASMRDDFEITTPEVDAVVRACHEAGAAGSRMTGGGFGGCVVSLVEEREFGAWLERVAQAAPGARFVC